MHRFFVVVVFAHHVLSGKSMAHNLPEQKDFISSKTIIMFGPACFSNMNNWFDTKGNRVSKVLNIMTNFKNKKTWLHNTFTINEFWRHGTMYHWYIYTFESMVQYISDSIYNFEGTVHCIILIQLQFQRHGTMYQWYIYNGTMVQCIILIHLQFVIWVSCLSIVCLAL